MILAKRATKWQSPRGGRAVKLVVIHGDAGKSDAGTIEWIANEKLGAKVSYHYLVGRNGRVTQFVEESECAHHAGVSAWKDCTVKNTVNPTSIGVAFANAGPESGEPYKDAQYVAGAELVAGICKRHGLKLKDVVGHADVSPGRKTDPWEHFDWERFMEALAAAGVPA